jgi:hypothetical protein
VRTTSPSSRANMLLYGKKKTEPGRFTGTFGMHPVLPNNEQCFSTKPFHYGRAFSFLPSAPFGSMLIPASA